MNTHCTYHSRRGLTPLSCAGGGSCRRPPLPPPLPPLLVRPEPGRTLQLLQFEVMMILSHIHCWMFTHEHPAAGHPHHRPTVRCVHCHATRLVHQPRTTLQRRGMCIVKRESVMYAAQHAWSVEGVTLGRCCCRRCRVRRRRRPLRRHLAAAAAPEGCHHCRRQVLLSAPPPPWLPPGKAAAASATATGGAAAGTLPRCPANELAARMLDWPWLAHACAMTTPPPLVFSLTPRKEQLQDLSWAAHSHAGGTRAAGHTHRVRCD